MDVDDLAALAEDIFGMDRVHQVERGRRDRTGIGLVDALGEFKRAGVLITGSAVIRR